MPSVCGNFDISMIGTGDALANSSRMDMLAQVGPPKLTQKKDIGSDKSQPAMQYRQPANLNISLGQLAASDLAVLV